jgi:hypothetical protein
MIMSSGPNHAADMCSVQEIEAAADASVYYGLAGLAEVIRRVPDASDDDTADLEVGEAYNRLVPNDDTMDRAFRRRLSNRQPTSSRSWRRTEPTLEHSSRQIGAVDLDRLAAPIAADAVVSAPGYSSDASRRMGGT